MDRDSRGAEHSPSGRSEAPRQAGLGDLFAEPGDWRGMRFGAISLWPPYSHLPLYGLKPWETRSRPYPAKYHGRRIVVASTKAFTPRDLISQALHELCSDRIGPDYQRTLSRGVALYTIVLKGCERTEDGVHRVPPELLCTGDFSPGRWMWEWGDVEPLNPFPVHGGQGWWFCDVPDGAFRCATVAAQSSQTPTSQDASSEARQVPGNSGNPSDPTHRHREGGRG